jgi:catechol 2,3-dioxygenase-like lactoylglutathione lyase family enzyme
MVMEMRLELVLVPVTDVDRAKAFYTEKCGFGVDVDHSAGDEFRVVQMTPPGSACSISVGKGITKAAPGSVENLHLVVKDIQAVRDELASRGVDIGEVSHFEGGGMVPGPDPEDRPFGSFAFFSDPDGNSWALQQGPR